MIPPTADEARRLVDIYQRHAFPDMVVGEAVPVTVGDDETTGWAVTFTDGDDQYTVHVTGYQADDQTEPESTP